MIRKDRGDTIIYQQFCNRRCSISCICDKLFNAGVSDLVKETLKSPAVMQISGIHRIIQYPPVLITGSPDGISKDLFMLAFMKPSAFRIGRGFFYIFCLTAVS